MDIVVFIKSNHYRVNPIPASLPVGKSSLLRQAGCDSLWHVSWSNIRQKWISVIYFKSKQHRLGGYTRKEDAAMAYNKAAIKLFGEFACLNKLE